MKSKSYISLSFLRIVFIFLIFLEHYPVTPLRVGGKAVCFFFILSGFVLSYGYGNKLSIEGMTYKNFLLPRLIKLYTLHWLSFPFGVWIGRDFLEQMCCGDNFKQRHMKFTYVINELSNISFSFYLLHQIVILALFNHKPLNLLDNNIAKFIIILITCTLIAYIFHHYFERSISRKLKCFITK